MPSAAAVALSSEIPRGAPVGRARVLLVLAPGLCYLSLGCWAVVLPGWVLHRLGGTSTEVGLTMGLAPLAAVLLRASAGSLGDRVGRRRPAVAGAALIALGGLVLLGPRSIALVVLSRLLLGAGDALFATSVLAWAVEGVASERHGRAMSTIGMSIWMGTALAPQWATLVRQLGGYDAVWIGAFAAPALAAAAVRGVPDTRRQAAPRRPGARARIPRGALLPALAMLCACYGDGVFEGFGIVHLTARGVPAGGGIGGAASVFTILAVTTFLGRFAGGALADRVAPRRQAMVAMIVLAAGYGVLALASSFAVAAGAAVLMGIGLALIYPALGVLVSTRVAPEERGAGFGVYLASLDVAFGLGPALGGLIVAASSTAVALGSGAAVALLASPLVLLTARGGEAEASR